MNSVSDFFIHEQFLALLFDTLQTHSEIAIAAHTNADPDALASALGLRALLAQFFPKKRIDVILPELNAIAKNLWQKFEFNSPLYEISTHWPEHLDILIIVDATDFNLLNAPYQLNAQGNFDTIQEIFVIDHHAFAEKSQYPITEVHILPEYSSATEIIIEFYRYYQVEPDINIAKFLLAGIITDTGHFRYANGRTLDNARVLLDKGILIAEINSALYNRMGRSEKIARIKAAMRISNLHYVNQFVVAISHVSSYEASACKALLELGADLSLIIAFERKKNRFRMSGRAREDIIQQYSFHLGAFMSQFGKQFQGSGGGHDGAAGCYGNLPPPTPQPRNTSSHTSPHLVPSTSSKMRKEDFDAYYFALLEPTILKLLRNMIN